MGWLKPDVEKMEADKDVKRLLRTLKYDEDNDVRNRAAEALKNISRGETEEVTEKISESELMKEAEGTIPPQLKVLIAGIGLIVIQIVLGVFVFNLIFTVPLYFFTSLISGYLWPKFYKGLGVFLVIPWIVYWWVSLFSSTKVDMYFFGILIVSLFFFLVTLLGSYIGYFISVLQSEGSPVLKRKKGWIKKLALIIVFMFILRLFLFHYF